MSDYELVHYGVKGMKWGVRRYQNKDGSLTDKGIKKYARKGYAQDSFNKNKSVLGKAYDAYTGAHKIRADVTYKKSSKEANKARAEKYLNDKQQKKANPSRIANKETAAKLAKKGAEVVGKMALASAVDDIFYGGMGKRIAKETIKQTGRAAVTAFVMANGGYDIHWFDN